MTAATDTLDTLRTPALVLDRRKLCVNCERVSRKIPRHVRLRPHLKTSKSIDVARVALKGREAVGAVSTIKEAEYFHEHGLSDLTYCVGVAPDKLPRVARLLHDGADLKIITDDKDVAREIGRRGLELGTQFSCYVEVDVDGHRAGVTPGGDEALAIARSLHEFPGARLAGVLTHAGESYACASGDERTAAAEAERLGALAAAERIRALGIPCPEVSVGSSPTVLNARTYDGLTEVRAGVYAFWDLFQANLGVCSIDDIAVSVLATVVGHQRRRDQLILDAGGHALSKDRGTASQRVDYGFGLVCDLDGRPLPGMLVNRANQEHGVVESTGPPIDFDRYPIGARVRVLPNHACATAACHDRYAVVDGGREIVGAWPRINGW